MFNTRGIQSNRRASRFTLVALLAVVLVLAMAGIAFAGTGITTAEENVAGPLWTAGWSPYSSAALSGGSYLRTNTPGAAVTIAFAGTSLKLLSYKGTTCGFANVTVDGGTPAQVDFYADKSAYKASVFEVNNLPDGPHWVRIECAGASRSGAAGNWIGLDSLEVGGVLTDASLVSLYTSYEENSTGPMWSAGWTSYSSAALSGGAYRRTNVPGAAVTIAFNGSALRWLSYKGAACGIADVTVDGGVPVQVDLYSPTSAYKQEIWKVTGLANGPHTVQITCTGTRRAAATANYIGVDALEVAGAMTDAAAPTLNTYEENAVGPLWSGSWSIYNSSAFSGGAYRRTTSPGAHVTIAFTGTSLRWLSYKGAACGIAQLVVDGGAPIQVDLYSPTSLYKQEIWKVGGLANGPHTVQITCTGTHRAAATGNYIGIDSLEVGGTLN